MTRDLRVDRVECNLCLEGVEWEYVSEAAVERGVVREVARRGGPSRTAEGEGIAEGHRLAKT